MSVRRIRTFSLRPCRGGARSAGSRSPRARRSPRRSAGSAGADPRGGDAARPSPTSSAGRRAPPHRRRRGRARALRARPAALSRHPLHPDATSSSTICAACRPRRCARPTRPSSARSSRSRCICEIRDRAATILRDAGYIAAVEVPEQRIADGNVRFQVLMAKLVGLRVRGDAGRAERTIAAYLEPADRARGVQPLRGRALSAARRRPARLRRPAGACARPAGARRGDRRGHRRPRSRRWSTSPSRISARASSAAGAALLRGQVFGLTGLGDRTTLAFFTHRRFRRAADAPARPRFPARQRRPRLRRPAHLRLGAARPRPSGVDVESRTLFATVEASYPFIRRQARTLRGAIGLDIIDQDVEFNGLPLNRDRLRVAFARLDLRRARALAAAIRAIRPAEPRWRVGASLEVRQGLGHLRRQRSAAARRSPPASRPARCRRRRLEGDPTATVLRAAAYGEVPADPALTFALGVRGQYSGNPLFSFEEFSAGNYTVGRGYDPGTLLGDSGIGFQAELRFGTPVAAPRRTFAPSPMSSSTMPGSGTRIAVRSSPAASS